MGECSTVVFLQRLCDINQTDEFWGVQRKDGELTQFISSEEVVMGLHLTSKREKEEKQEMLHRNNFNRTHMCSSLLSYVCLDSVCELRILEAVSLNEITDKYV